MDLKYADIDEQVENRYSNQLNALKKHKEQLDQLLTEHLKTIESLECFFFLSFHQTYHMAGGEGSGGSPSISE